MSTSFERDIPYCVKPGALWDGATYYLNVPSNDSGSLVEVVGEGTNYPLGYTRAELFDLLYNMAYVKVTYGIDFDGYEGVDDFGPPYWTLLGTGLGDNVTDQGYTALEQADRRAQYVEFIYSGSWATGAETVVKHKDLACPKEFWQFFQQFGPGADVTIASVRLFAGIGTRSRILSYDDLYWPYIDLSVGSFVSTLNGFVGNVKGPLPAYITSRYTTSATFLGRSVTLYGNGGLDVDTPASYYGEIAGVINSANLTVTLSSTLF